MHQDPLARVMRWPSRSLSFTVCSPTSFPHQHPCFVHKCKTYGSSPASLPRHSTRAAALTCAIENIGITHSRATVASTSRNPENQPTDRQYGCGSLLHREHFRRHRQLHHGNCRRRGVNPQSDNQRHCLDLHGNHKLPHLWQGRWRPWRRWGRKYCLTKAVSTSPHLIASSAEAPHYKTWEA